MHIAWLGKKSPFCGNVTYGREVTNALLDRGYDVSFLHFAQEETTNADHWAESNDFPIPCLYKSQIYTIPTFKSSRILKRSLQKLKPDVVHASLTLSPLDFVLPEICEELDLPLVATFHPAFDRKVRNISSGTQLMTYQLYAPFLANYDCVIVFSRIQRDLLMKLGVPKAKIAIIPNGVDAEKYSPGFSTLKADLKCDRLFVYQGRLAVEKNVESLLKAWKQANLGPECKLAIVGNGHLAPSLMSNYGNDPSIVWMGFIADEAQRIKILRGSDVFILPSLVEGLSLSLLEAMACGLACVATDAGADGEVLEQGAGIVLGTQKVSSQLQTVLPLFQDHPEFSALLGRKARQRVLERYTLTRNITELEALYHQVLQRQRVYSRSSV